MIKSKLTRKEHQKLGIVLKRLDKKLSDGFELSGYKNKVEANKSHEWKAKKLLSELKSELDEIVVKDYPRYINSGIYYGKEEDSLS